jgi:CHAT domain-containing protein
VAFADPAYPHAEGAATASPSLKRAMGTGLRLDPLPLTRREAAALQAIAPGSARVWLGAEATEERAKAVGRGARILHFACHGFLDEASPLESGLALAIPPEGRAEGDNGLLQAWEVFEGERLDADLVTLSACQTGLGKETAGEGLLGLTWAFQYAGARSVLASLWEVNDASTADLMRSFYGHLSRGEPKAQALRAAQIQLLHQPATSAPYFWAAFNLIGGWR